MPLRHMGWIVAALVVLSGCTSGADDPSFRNPLDPDNEGALPAPESVEVTIGNAQVSLSWQMPDGETAARYAVFRREVRVDTGEEDLEKIAEVTEAAYTDRQVRNGRLYAYRIAAGAAAGAFGKRTEEIQASPALFSIVIASDAVRTGSAGVTLALSAPSGTEAVQISEDPAFTGASFQRFSGQITFSLSFGDGEKTVHARFRLADGSISLPVSDSILLDSRAVIQSVTFDGETVRAPGEMIHFRIDGGEPEGTATIDVTGLFTGLELFDDGTNGDVAAGDGVYERTAEIPAGRLVTRQVVTGRFTDGARNNATAVDAPRTLTVQLAPEAVTLLEGIPAEPPVDPRVTLRWTQSRSDDFGSYRLFRDDTPEVDTGSELVGTASAAATVELNDVNVTEGETYYYRVYVRSREGLETGSNVVTVAVPNVRPPDSVDLAPLDGSSETSLYLRWRASSELDFAAYEIHRSENGVVDDSDPQVARIEDRDTIIHLDTGLVENTQYFYRLYVVDTAGLKAPSQILGGRTLNAAPEPVVLTGISDVDTSAVTVAWTESNAHDFASYRVYRDFGPGVGTFSTLVATIEQSEVLQFRDTGLTPGTRYHYRVFVFDDGERPGVKSAGSNVRSVTTQDSP